MSDPISEYFAQFPDFEFRPSLDDWRQIGAFNALAQKKHWPQEFRKQEFEEFKATWTSIVEAEFAEDTTLPHYQSLCRDLRVDPIPDSITGCKNELATIYVNIVDLVQYRRNKREGRRLRPVRLFNNLQELREYTFAQQKWYPRETAKAEMLRELLKVLQ
jgi:hypothetical protein